MIASIRGLKFWEGSGVEGTGIWIGAVVFARVFAFSEGTQKWRHRSAGGGRRGPVLWLPILRVCLLGRGGEKKLSWFVSCEKTAVDCEL